MTSGALLLFWLLALAACGSPAPVEDESTATALPRATPTVVEAATSTPDAYPLPATPAPAPATGGYPAAPPPATVGPPTAYPADTTIWVLRPLGTQCQEAAAYAYADLEEAVAALNELDVEVLASEVVERAVCEACSCPTSEHFRVQILRNDLPAARMRGWNQETE